MEAKAYLKPQDAKVKTSGNPNPGGKHRRSLARMLRHREMMMALGSGLLMLIGWMAGLFALPGWISTGLYIAAYGLGGFTKARDGVTTLLREKDLDVNLLMIAAATGAAAIGYWNEGAMLIFIFALSGALESYASEQSKKDISALAALRPEVAVRLEDGERREVRVEELAVGDLLLIRPDEIIPADGIIQNGDSYVNQASITGESVPLRKGRGDEVYAGTLNEDSVLYVTVSSPAEGTLFAKIIKLVEQAEKEAPRTQQFIKRLEGTYAKVVLAVTAALLLLLPLVLGWSWQQTFYKSMVFLVVASPCALVSSVMPAMLSAMSRSARRGVLFKGAASMDRLAGVKAAAFDKTGTLTLGEPVLTEIFTLEGWERSEVLAASASVEQWSGHPLARAVLAEALKENLELLVAEDVQSLPGRGIQASIAGKLWIIEKANEQDMQLPDQLREGLRRLAEQGNTVSTVSCDGQYGAVLGIRDEIRPEAKEAIARLHRLGIKTVMLTGDRKVTADSIAAEAGIDEVYGDLLPEEKLERVKELGQRIGQVAMIGDGVNDAPALATASVGIAMGEGGSGAALDVADVVLMNGKLDRLADTLELAARARRIVRQNLIFAGAVILLLVISNFIQNIPLPLGVIGHEGSTILVILNGLRLLRK